MTAVNGDGSAAIPPTPGTVRRKSRRLRKKKRRTMLIRVTGSFLGLMLIFLAAIGVLTHQVLDVKGQLEQAMSLIPKLRTDLVSGNGESALETLDEMKLQISSARATATGPLWKAAAFVPFAGPNFDAIGEVAVSADDIATRAIEPLLSRYDSLDWESLSPANGRIDVGQLQDAAPTISTAANTVRLSFGRLEGIDSSSLLPQVAEPFRSVTKQLKEISEALESASAVSRLLPSMVGAGGPRSYLVLIQNSAEARATGGIPGALAILRTDDGLISMGAQSSAGDLGLFTPPFDVDAEQESLYTARLGSQMQNVNLTPDFPTAALTAKKMWEKRHTGPAIDGVISLDPVVLAHLLEATGPVQLSDPEVLRLISETSLPTALTSENVVSTLLSDVYREIEDPVAQDIYFAAVASQVFTAFTTGEGDNSQLVKALNTSVHEHRLNLWSDRSSEQDIIATTALSGSVVGSRSGGATFGVYSNDGTGAKMDFYVQRTAQLLQTCQSDGYSRYTVRLNITNNAPQDAATSLPPYVTGGGVFGVKPGNIRTNYVFYGPAQSFAETATVNGQAVPIGSGKHGQRPVGTVSLELDPGESAEMDVVFSRVVQDTEPRIEVTPSIESSDNVILPIVRNGCG